MSERIVPKDFYVYLHRKATTGEVFYVGKGYGRRAWSNQRSQHWHLAVKKHGFTVQIIESGLQEWYSFELERELIAFYGRDILCNMTDGGDGISGFTHGARARQLVSQARKGKPLSKEHRAKLSLAKIGTSKPDQVRSKTSATKRKKSKKILCVENGLIFEAGVCAQKWLQANGAKVGARSAVYDCCKGNRKTAYGYTWRYA
jgi:hypothetical protein